MTGAIALPDDPEQPPLETEGVGEDPGSLSEVDGPAVEPIAQNDPAPDVNDGEAPTPIADSTSEFEPAHDIATPPFDDDQDDPDAAPSGQHGPTADYGER